MSLCGQTKMWKSLIFVWLCGLVCWCLYLCRNNGEAESRLHFKPQHSGSVSVLTCLFTCCVSSEIRAQLVEQQKCLDQQTEMRVQLLQDLQDFFRKKAEIEMEYSRNLEKLAERFMAKTRSTKDHQQYKWGDTVLVCSWCHLDSFIGWTHSIEFIV